MKAPASVAVLVCLCGLIFASTATAQNLDKPCGDTTLVFARGSGSGLGEVEAKKFFSSVKDRLGPSVDVNTYELGSESYGGAKYLAVGIGFGSLQSFKNMTESDASWTGFAGGKYRDSVRGGVTELKTYLTQRAAKCEDEALVVGGYSQGAQVVGDALPGLTGSVRDQIAYVALFGDPRLYLPEGRGPFPPACRGKEFSPWRRGSVSCWTDNGILESRVPYLPADLEHRTGSWCDRSDPICDSNLSDYIYNAHDEYANDGAEIDEAAQEIAVALEGRLPDKASDIDTSVLVIGLGTAGLDVAFVIDTTGSMAGSIDAARSIAKALGEQIVSLRGRVALTEYRDYGDPVVAQVVTPFSDDIDGFKTALDGLFASGGGDTPEALLYALMTTFNGLDWTPEATKAVVVITDADYHDPDLAGGYTLSDVVSRALEIDPVNVYPVVPSYETEFYGPLAEGTSGRVTLNEGDTASAILGAIDEIETRPVALLAASEYLAAPGEEVLFDASSSYDPDSTLTSFEWDFDGDGNFDETTVDPSATHIYPEEFEGLIEVRVRSADGGVANAVANVEVNEAGLSNEDLEAPRGLSATVDSQGAGGRHVTLSWGAPQAGAPVGGWVVRDGTGEVLGRREAAARSFAVADVPLEGVTFSVAATNEFGTGAAATVEVPPFRAADEPRRAGSAVAERAALKIRRLSLTRRKFVAASKDARIAGTAAPGSRIKYRLSEAATVRFLVSNDKGKRVGSFSSSGVAGPNSLFFSGRLHGRALAPGQYQLEARASDSSGRRSQQRTVGFRIAAP